MTRISHLILVVLVLSQLAGYSTSTIVIASVIDSVEANSVDREEKVLSTTDVEPIGNNNDVHRHELDTPESLLITSLLLVVNSSLAVLDYDYSLALSKTIAEVMNLQTSNIAVKWSKTQNRRLLTLYVVLVEAEINIPFEDIPPNYQSNISAMTNDLKTNFSKIVLNGAATSTFRHNLETLGVDFDCHIGIAAIQFAIAPHDEDANSFQATNNTQTSWFSDFVDASVDEAGGPQNLTIIMACLTCIFVVNLAYYFYYLSFYYCVGRYRWNKVIKSVSASFDHQVNPTIGDDDDNNSIIASEFVLGSMSEDEPYRYEIDSEG